MRGLAEDYGVGLKLIRNQSSDGRDKRNQADCMVVIPNFNLSVMTKYKNTKIQHIIIHCYNALDERNQATSDGGGVIKKSSFQ